MYPPQLLVKVTFSEPSGNNALDAEETGQIKLTIKNVGQGAARNLSVSLTLENVNKSLSYKKQSTIPLIEPNSTKSLTIPIKASVDVSSMKNRFKITIKEPYFKAHPPAKTLTFSTHRFLPPAFVFTEMGLDDSNNSAERATTNNGKIELNETIVVMTNMQNVGEGKAENVKVNVSLEQKNVMLLSQGSFVFSEIDPSQVKTFTLRMFVNAEFSDSKIKIKFSVRERLGKFGTDKIFTLPINKTLLAADEVTIIAKRTETASESITDKPESDVDLNIPQGKINRPKAIAVVIGNKEYDRSDVSNVDYAIADAQAVKRYLVKALGYREDNILFLHNVSKGGFESVFGNAQNYEGELFSLMVFMEKPEELFIYYSGHGHSKQGKDKNGREDNFGYFVPRECNPQTVSLSGYSLNVFANNLNKLVNKFKVKQTTVVIDACFSGYLTKQASPIGWKINDPLLKIKNISYFTSSSGAQKSFWYPAKKHGLFTYFFLKGLQGKNGSLGKDKKITVDELGKYIKSNVYRYARNLHNQNQTPQVSIRNKGWVLVRY